MWKIIKIDTRKFIFHPICVPGRISTYVNLDVHEIEWRRFCVRATPIVWAHITCKPWIETNGSLWFSLRLSWEWSSTIEIVRYVRGIHVAIRAIYAEVDYRIRYSGTRAGRDRFHRKQRCGFK